MQEVIVHYHKILLSVFEVIISFFLYAGVCLDISNLLETNKKKNMRPFLAGYSLNAIFIYFIRYLEWSLEQPSSVQFAPALGHC